MVDNIVFTYPYRFAGRIFQARPKLFGKPKVLRELGVAERQPGFACGADLMENRPGPDVETSRDLNRA
jgi:hypothetical protein